MLFKRRRAPLSFTAESGARFWSDVMRWNERAAWIILRTLPS